MTKQEETAGLLADTARIGFRLNWERIVAEKGLGFQRASSDRNRTAISIEAILSSTMAAATDSIRHRKTPNGFPVN